MHYDCFSLMKMKSNNYELYLIGWVRDQKGRILHRPRKTVCNAITSFTGGVNTKPTMASHPPVHT